MNNILKRALISEKSFGKAGDSKYTFIVAKDADKQSIAAECASLFGVTVLDVNTANYLGKIKRTRKGVGKRSDFKKAVITLKSGEKINLFEFETEESKEEKKKEKKA